MSKFKIDAKDLVKMVTENLTGQRANITITGDAKETKAQKARASVRGLTLEDEQLFEMLKKIAAVKYSKLTELDQDLAASKWLAYANENCDRYTKDFPGQTLMVHKLAALTDWTG